MCGRMALTLPPEAMAQIFEAAPANTLPAGPNYNICPTDEIAVITSGPDAPRRMETMRWGLIPRWYKHPTDGPLLINARAETVLEKPAFRAAVRTRRVLIPASGFMSGPRMRRVAAIRGTSPGGTVRRSRSPVCGRAGRIRRRRRSAARWPR